MSSKPFMWTGLIVGSALGGFLPSLWGASIFSLWSVILTAVGGIAGVWFGLKLDG